jgi:hypothetical protein
MFEQKNAERKYAGQLMELTQNKGPAQTNRHEGTPLRDGLSKAGFGLRGRIDEKECKNT